MDNAKLLKKKEPLRPLMIVGTGSNVGKSVITTALCRIFKQDGYTPAPFKAQNITINIAYTPNGLEIGLAQALQAEAAKAVPHTDMNPLLRKPIGDGLSQLLLHGRVVPRQLQTKEDLITEVHTAYNRLHNSHNPIIIEGAGSIAELNLKANDFINMSMAKYAEATTILVADIDRGGVFAALYGTLTLLPPDERKWIKGIIVNKFRGSTELFSEGKRIIEEICGVPVLGVIPFINNLNIEEEDATLVAPISYAPSDVQAEKEDKDRRETEYDRLAQHLRTHLDLATIYRLLLH